MKIQPVILAGGNGYRVWPLSQKINPKQFVKYFDNFSSFQSTVIRNAYLGVPLIVANVSHRDVVIAQLAEIKSQAKIIFEPEQKNTASSAILASFYAKINGIKSIILIPSDHHIENQLNYKKTVSLAIKAIKDFKFCVIGITPTVFNRNFGYIKINKRIQHNLYLGSEFIEKPDIDVFTKFSHQSTYFWNSGIYFFDIKHVLKIADEFIPNITNRLSKIFQHINNNNVITLAIDAYDKLETISFDNAISINISRMALVKAEFKWMDLGSWESLWTIDQKDHNQNNLKGIVIAHNVKNSYISSDAKQTLAINLKDTIIVLKDGKLLVAHKDGTELIKEIVTKFNET